MKQRISLALQAGRMADNTSSVGLPECTDTHKSFRRNKFLLPNASQTAHGSGRRARDKCFPHQLGGFLGLKAQTPSDTNVKSSNCGAGEGDSAQLKTT